jgi:hypothetical protein
MYNPTVKIDYSKVNSFANVGCKVVDYTDKKVIERLQKAKEDREEVLAMKKVDVDKLSMRFEI